MGNLRLLIAAFLVSCGHVYALESNITGDTVIVGPNNSDTKILKFRDGTGAPPSIESTTGNISVKADLTTTGKVVNQNGTLELGDGTSKENPIVFKQNGLDALIKYSTTANALVFDNGDGLEKKLGTGSGSGSGGFNNLENAGFEDGIAVSYTCTASRCTEETVAPLFGEKSLKFTPVAQNDEFRSSLKAIPVGIMGQSCSVKIYYTGGDENLKAQVINGNGVVLGEKSLPSHSFNTFEMFDFICASKTEIDADALAGQYQVVILNSESTIAPTATFDEFYIGENLALSQTVFPDEKSVILDAACSVIADKYSIINSCSKPSNGICTCSFNEAYATVPRANISVDHASSTDFRSIQFNNVTTTGFSFVVKNNSNTNSDAATYFLSIEAMGADAKETKTVYKSIPKQVESTGDFNAFISGTGDIIANENVTGWLQSCTNPVVGQRNCLLATELQGKSLNCNASAVSSNAVNSANAFRNGNNIEIRTSVGGVATDVTASVFCSLGAGSPLPVVQPAFINQVETTYKDGVHIVSCEITNNGTSTINLDSGLCASWISSVSRTSAGETSLVIKDGVFSKRPVCFGDAVSIPIYARAQASSTTAAVLTTYNSGESPTDFDAKIICIGAR